MDLDALKQQIREQARALGFVACGFAPTVELDHDAALQRWLDAGMAGTMASLGRTRALRADPRQLLAGARAAIVVLASYRPRRELAPAPPIVARYARGADYHLVVRERLRQLERWLRRRVAGGEGLATRVAVDTAPLLERELAVAAGLGFIGKNTLLITPGHGSFTVIGELLVSLALPPDPQLDRRDGCEGCQLCLDACPGGALTAPRVLDARRCVSYLTIEHRGDVAADRARSVGGRLFGCDTCQEVCPHNQLAADRRHWHDEALAPDRPPELELVQALRLRSGAYRRLVAGRALARASRAQLVRNAAIVAGNIGSGGDRELRQALRAAAAGDGPAARAARRALREIDAR